jgi:hypothetical protein
MHNHLDVDHLWVNVKAESSNIAYTLHLAPNRPLSRTRKSSHAFGQAQRPGGPRVMSNSHPTVQQHYPVGKDGPQKHDLVHPIEVVILSIMRVRLNTRAKRYSVHLACFRTVPSLDKQV